MKPIHLAAAGAVLAVGLVVLLMMDRGDGPARTPDRSGTTTAPDRSNGAPPVADDAPDGLGITVRIERPDGGPGGGAAIRLRGAADRRAAADPAGTVRIDGLEAGAYVLVARAGDAAGTLPFDLTTTTDLGTLRLAAAATVRGHVYTARGAPVPGARVEAIVARPRGSADMTRMAQVLTQPEPVAADATTDATGAYELPLAGGGRYALRVTAAGFAQETEGPRPVAGDLDGIDFYLLPGVAVAGRVTDGADRAVAGARVMLADPMTTWTQRATKLETATAADGTFAMDAPASNNAMLVVRAPGFAVHVKPNVQLPATDLAITLEAGFTMRVAAADERGAPAAGVEVLASYRGGAGSGRTDEHGEVVFLNLPTTGRTAWGRQQQAMLMGGGFVGTVVNLERAEPQDGLLDVGPVVLQRGGTVTGRVLDEATSRPVAGAAVRTFGGIAQQLDWIGATKTTSGPDGAYRLEGVPLGATTLLAVHPDYVSDLNPMRLTRERKADPLFPDGETELRRDIPLLPAALVEGTVVGPGGDTVAGAQVAVNDPLLVIGRTYGGMDAVVFSGPGGRFVLRGLHPDRPVPLRATHDDFGASEEVAAKPGALVTLHLGLPQRLFGRVEDEAGAPIGAVKVSAKPVRQGGNATSPWLPATAAARPTVTANDGTWVLRNVPAGEVEVTWSHAAYQEEHRTVQVGAGETERDLGTTVLGRGLGIEGIVVDPDGAPLAKVNVTASIALGPGERRSAPKGPGRMWGRAETDAAGRFAIFGLREGRFQLAAQGSGFSDRPVVPAGASDVRIVVRDAATLEGRVLWAGQPVARASVRATVPNPAKGGRPDFLAWARTAEDGTFELKNLPPDRAFAVAVSHVAYLDTTFPGVRVGAARDFVVERGRVVRGVVLNPDGRPVAMAQVRVLVDGKRVRDVRTGDDGAWEIGGLDPGAITVQLQESGQGYLREEPRPAREGELVRIVAKTGLEIHGAVLDADGNPVHRCSVQAHDGTKTVATVWVRGNSDGTFVLRGLQPGRYTVRASVAGRTAEVADVEAGATGVELRVR